MDALMEYFGLESYITLFESVKDMLISCVRVVSKCFAWLGPEFSFILVTGIVIAIGLRIFGR